MKKTEPQARSESGKFIMKCFGTSKKVAPINMRKEEHQFVIDGFLVNEVLGQIPAGMKIIQGYIHLVSRSPDTRITVPNALKKLGVASMRTSGSRNTVAMIFDEINKEALKTKVMQACKATNMPYQKAYFRHIVLSNGSANVKFEHCTKEIKPDELDLRKKLRVLGATMGTGKVQELIAEMGAKKFKCIIKEEPVKFVMCTRE